MPKRADTPDRWSIDGIDAVDRGIALPDDEREACSQAPELGIDPVRSAYVAHEHPRERHIRLDPQGTGESELRDPDPVTVVVLAPDPHADPCDQREPRRSLGGASRDGLLLLVRSLHGSHPSPARDLPYSDPLASDRWR